MLNLKLLYEQRMPSQVENKVTYMHHTTINRFTTAAPAAEQFYITKAGVSL